MDEFIRDIIEFFHDPENVKAFEEWQKQLEDGDKP